MSMYKEKYCSICLPCLKGGGPSFAWWRDTVICTNSKFAPCVLIFFKLKVFCHCMEQSAVNNSKFGIRNSKLWKKNALHFSIIICGPPRTDNAQFLSEYNYIVLQNFFEILIKVCNNSYLNPVPTICFIFLRFYFLQIKSFW